MGKKVEAVKAVIEEYKARMIVDGEYAKTYISTIVKELEEALSGRKETGPIAHYLTAEDFTTGIGGDLLYIGPLADALAYAKRYGDYDGEPTQNETGMWDVTLLTGDNWGRGDTPELAWRYVFGAYFGPIDENFHPQYL